MRLQLLFVLTLFIVSCSRDTSEGPDIPPVDLPADSAGNPIGENTSQFIRMQAGPDLDTVYRFAYDNSNRIFVVVDSSSQYGSSRTPAYSSAGNITTMIQRWDRYPDDSAVYTYTYNASNQLTQIDYIESFTPTRIVITYSNGVPQKRTLSYAFAGAYTTSWTWNYTVRSGNITSIQQFDGDGNLYQETSYTFNADVNALKPLAIFADPNYGGLSLSDAGNLDAWFNKNLIATSTTSGIETDYTYTYNDKKQLTQVVIATLGGMEEGILTRTFGY